MVIEGLAPFLRVWTTAAEASELGLPELSHSSIPSLSCAAGNTMQQLTTESLVCLFLKVCPSPTPAGRLSSGPSSNIPASLPAALVWSYQLQAEGLLPLGRSTWASLAAPRSSTHSVLCSGSEHRLGLQPPLAHSKSTTYHRGASWRPRSPTLQKEGVPERLTGT